MNLVLFFLLVQPPVSAQKLFLQERSGLTWGLILSILLILALVILWWLLGPGAKQRRRRMTDLPKPAQTAPAALPTGPVPPVPVVRVDEPADKVPPTEGVEAPDKSAFETVVDESVEESSMEAPSPDDRDDLRKIEGIGPKVAGILNASGIATFAQLAETSVESLMGILEAEGLKFMKPDTWPEQAAFAAKGDWDGLQALRDRLKGERQSKE